MNERDLPKSQSPPFSRFGFAVGPPRSTSLPPTQERPSHQYTTCHELCILHRKATSFIRTNSYPSGSVVVPDGVDPDIASNWVSLIESEQAFISLIGTIGDVLWPWIPLLVWIFCIYESYLIFNDRYRDPIHPFKVKYHSILSRISTTSDKYSERTISRNMKDRVESLRANADSWLTARTASLFGTLGKQGDTILQKAGIGEGRRTESGSKPPSDFFWHCCCSSWFGSLSTHPQTSCSPRPFKYRTSSHSSQYIS